MRTIEQRIFLVVTLMSCMLYYACTKDQSRAKDVFHNHHDSVKYVGAQTCATCHTDKFDSFQLTGMGQSFDLAKKKKSVAQFENVQAVYDSFANLYYYPFWENDSFKIMEFRLSKKDTIFQRTETINHIIGSGQHTNSHIMNRNGYMFQLPLTWYAQRKIWDLPPGFENGANSRFDRIIGLECMTCHNALPKFVEGSHNKYESIPLGIDCERCHGPGELHVNLKRSGIHVDVRTETDSSIVNPAKLSEDLQMDICQRCHLQGNAVLQEGKSFMDFKPGMKLNEVFDVFLPRYRGDNEDFIMASHPDRLRMSACYLKTHTDSKGTPNGKQLTCVTCHDPHHSVTLTDKSAFNTKCKSCHSTSQACGENIEQRNLLNNNCIGCHMKKSGTSDIPHVVTTDHFIRIYLADTLVEKQKEFIGIACLTSQRPKNSTIAKGWINYYEKFDANPVHLDSALYYTEKTASKTNLLYYKIKIHLLYLKKMYTLLTNLAETISPDSSLNDWTYYRIGEAYFQQRKLPKALDFFNMAVDKAPFVPEFRNKQGSVLLEMGKIEAAAGIFTHITEENPTFAPAFNNLGYAFMLKQVFGEAEKNFEISIALNPDYELALANLASLYKHQNKHNEAKKMVRRLLIINPINEGYKKFLESL